MVTYTKKIDGELKKIETSNLEWLWGDGRYGSRPTHLYKHPEKDMFFLENRTSWQGEKDRIKILDREEAIGFLKSQGQHPTRQIDALEEIGVDLKEV